MRISDWSSDVCSSDLGFYETFTDFQAQTYSALLTSFQLTNAGKLITQGAEVEAVLRPVDGLSLSGNLAYTDTEVRGLIVSCYAGQSAAQGCVGGRQDVTGAALTNAPKWAYTLNANYGTDIGTPKDKRPGGKRSFRT